MDRSNASRRGIVIVALPFEDDRVRKVSSEKEPHLTLLYLDGADFDASQVKLITEYVEHAASMLAPFSLDVKRRGTLGDQNADVLFFDKKWSKNIEMFRSMLLSNDLISQAYLSTEQFPEWVPHLTLGYPETPAKKFPEDIDRFWTVHFDRVALWIDDYEGPTFDLDFPEHHYDDMGVAMSHVERGRSAMDGLLHYGIKGMKWGVRRSEAQLARSKNSPKPQLSEDAKTVNRLHGKIETKGTGSLSNQEMRQFLERMDLESRYARMTSEPPGKSRMDRGHDQVKKYLGMANTYAEVRRFLKTPAGQGIATGLKTAAAAGFGYATGGAGPAAAAGAGVLVRRMTR